MRNIDTFVQTFAFYGRVVDELTRTVIPYKHFNVLLENFKKKPIYKEDGYFVFFDLAPSNTDYRFHLTARFYQSRVIKKSLPTGPPIELTYPGEDELYVKINKVENKKVTFDTIPFLKTIPKGSKVIGEGGFITTLAETLEGENTGFAILEDIPGPGPGQILRFIRSNNILMYPGPYYPFEPGTTLVVLKFVDNGSPGMPPVPGVKCEIKQVNGKSIDTTPVGALNVKTVTLAEPADFKLVLGSENDLVAYSNERGDAVFYYPANTRIKKLKLQITAAGYDPITKEMTPASMQRNFFRFELTKI